MANDHCVSRSKFAIIIYKNPKAGHKCFVMDHFAAE